MKTKINNLKVVEICHFKITGSIRYKSLFYNRKVIKYDLFLFLKKIKSAREKSKSY